MVTTWKDKFLKREMVTAGELADRFNVHNYRLHPEQQAAIVEGSLDTLGWVGEVKVATGPPPVMFDGHLRVKLALAKGGPDMLVPTNYYELTAAEAKQALVLHDTTTGMAQTDFEIFGALLQEMPPLNIPAWDDWLGGFLGNYDDPYEEWAGMPEFEQEDNFGAIASIKVHFASESDLMKFSKLVEQDVNTRTVFIWYPRQKNEDLTRFQVVNEP